MSISFADVKDNLLTLEQARQRLSETEPLSEINFAMRGSPVRFRIQDGWSVGSGSDGQQIVPATFTYGRTEYQLTKDALLQATSFVGLTKQYVEKTPARLIEPHLQYWFTNTDKEMKILARDGVGVAFTKASISPFSNLRLLDEVVEAVQDKYDSSELYVDYKFHHDLRRTMMNFILPTEEHMVRGKIGHCVGVSLQNSLVGEKPLNLSGYIFTYICTNGMISTLNSSGNWSRRHGGQGNEVYDWAKEAVDAILGGFEAEFSALDVLSEVNVEGEINHVLSDIFNKYQVPLASRENIIEAAVESDDLTLFGVANAITQAANHEGASPEQRRHLMSIGGDLLHSAHRCDSCHRFLDN